MARYRSKDTSGNAEQFYRIPTDGALIFAKNSYDAFTNEYFVNTIETTDDEERQAFQRYRK